MTTTKGRQIEFRSAEIPPRLIGLRMADLSPSRAQAHAVDRCEQFVASFPTRYVSPERAPENYPEDPSLIGQGLLLVGPPGTGKTTLAALTLIELYLTWPGLFNYPEGRGRRPDRRIRFLAMADLLSMRIQTMRKDLDREEATDLRDSLDDAEQAVLLVLDDVGAEHKTATGYAQDEVSRLIRLRHRKALPTIITSNINPDDWSAVYGESLASFMHEAFEIVSIAGKDLRRS